MAPSTFASAAAGNTHNQNTARDGASEWSRRPNGATQTFRRQSNANSMTASNQPNDTPNATSSHPPRYVPPHRNGMLADTRYSRAQLLELFKTQQGANDGLQEGLSSLYVNGWQPEVANGTSITSWGRNEHARDPQHGPDVCWDRDGAVEPLALTEMDDEEREIFSTSVNTPLKPPTSQNKENQQSNGLQTRKVSISQNLASPGGFGLPSPTAARSGPRRRDTNEAYPFPNPLSSPSATREEQRAASPPPSLLRRRTDLKEAGRAEGSEKSGDEKTASSPFTSIKRNPAGPLSAGLGATASPWSTTPQSAAFSPMGSFGNFGSGGGTAQQPLQTDKRTGLGSGRAESRFKSLLQKDSSEDVGGRSIERKGSVSSLPRVHEGESWRPQERQDLANAPLDEEAEDVQLPSGSAALAGGSDFSPSHFRSGVRGFDTPSRSGTRDDLGFGAFGMTADHAPGFGHGKDAIQQTPAQQRSGLHMGSNEPMSPTDTNPYQSPEQHGLHHLHDDLDVDESELQSSHLPGLGGFGADQGGQHLGFAGLGAFSTLGRAAGSQGPASDRSQTSSTGPSRPFPGLGNLGQMGGMQVPSAWPVTQGGLGTPSRQAAGLPSAFGPGIFANSANDLQSPGLAGLGGSGGILSPQGTGAFAGGRMANVFPQGLVQHDQGNDRSSQHLFGGLGAGQIGQREGVFREQRGMPIDPEDADIETRPPPGGFGPPGQLQQSVMGQQSELQQLSSSTPSQPPAPQQRTMVMPDRMRWIYKDPQGQTQGPWSGLEMHDWYRAGFFSPELLVKKAEDTDYEPLAQLIRRIGNSREPFLVPQIGIPHGAPSTQGPWASSIPTGTPGGPAQPPFASSFPSFGTTLTAEQQNALERRKQEEQYLMARQKEHLAQAQIAQRMQQIQGPAHTGFSGTGQSSGPLHHHSSAQSLHSQPSFGSMTSPSAYQQSPVQGPSTGGHGHHDSSYRGSQSGGLGAVGAGVESLGHIREEEIPNIMDRLNLSGGSLASASHQFGAPGQPFGNQQGQATAADSTPQSIQQMFRDRAMLQLEQAQHDAAQQNELGQPVSNERLREFQQLQSQANALEARFQPALGKSFEQAGAAGQGVSTTQPTTKQSRSQETLSLTEQVQKAASAKASPTAAPQAWTKLDGGLPQGLPPPPSQSPLPAPAAQRTGRQSVADQLHVESSRSQTPSIDTPSAAVAPWAKETTELPKGPSLREIQEMEAKKAAEAEELAIAARRAALQKEIETQALAAAAAAATPIQPGLPSSANWAAANNGASPATPTGITPWAKTTQQKPVLTQTKSMAQIQKEEEARKKRQAAAQVQASASALGSVANSSAGKSYANLAGKVSNPATSGPLNSPWTTVGAGGKAKTPAGTPAPATVRAVSSGIVPTLQSTGPRKAPSRSATMTNSAAVNAQEEFRKWAVAELRPDLNKSIAAEDFVSTLIFLPPDTDIITEAVHGSSNTIDSRHFAEEFIRRKRLADKGLVDNTVPPKSASPHNVTNTSAGGWSEVAKKNPAKEPSKEEGNGNFRVVAAKKKGGKR